MSARRFRLRIASRAQQDIRSIRLYGLDQWGERQADAYHAALQRGFETLRAYPHIGVAKEDLGPGLRAFPIEHHVVFYRIKGNVIEIARILHERADASRHPFP